MEINSTAVLIRRKSIKKMENIALLHAGTFFVCTYFEDNVLIKFARKPRNLCEVGNWICPKDHIHGARQSTDVQLSPGRAAGRPDEVDHHALQAGHRGDPPGRLKRRSLGRLIFISFH